MNSSPVVSSNMIAEKAQQNFTIVQDLLVKRLGLKESYIVAKIYYWLENKKAGFYTEDNRHWIWNKYLDWVKELNFIGSFQSIGRLIRKLEKLGILISSTYDQLKKIGFKRNQERNKKLPEGILASCWNRTKWYSLNYELLADLLHTAKEEPEPLDNPSKEPQTRAITQCSNLIDSNVPNLIDSNVPKKDDLNKIFPKKDQKTTAGNEPPAKKCDPPNSSPKSKFIGTIGAIASKIQSQIQESENLDLIQDLNPLTEIEKQDLEQLKEEKFTAAPAPGEHNPQEQSPKQNFKELSDEEKKEKGELLREIDEMGFNTRELPNLKRLVWDCDTQRIKNAIATTLEAISKGKVKNPIGFLTKAIEKNWKPTKQTAPKIQEIAERTEKENRPDENPIKEIKVTSADQEFYQRALAFNAKYHDLLIHHYGNLFIYEEDFKLIPMNGRGEPQFKINELIVWAKTLNKDNPWFLCSLSDAKQYLDEAEQKVMMKFGRKNNA